MLTSLQQDIGFRYVRFHGILSDDMLVCHRGEDGTLQFSFILVDKVLDFLLSIGLKPLIQYSFMPSALAQDPNQTVFENPMIISPPKSMEEWNQLIRVFTEHILDRYGEKEVHSWLFSVWNEPDTSSQLFGFDKPKQFYELYENTYRIVKDVDPELCFGSPSLLPVHSSSYTWMKDYLDYASKRNCTPEFMDLHYYSDDFSALHYHNATFDNGCLISADPDHFSHFIADVQAFLKKYNMGHVPLYITEWNLTVSHRNLINDTCFKACHLAKNFLENYDRVDAIGYWSLTDLMEEHQPHSELFHGGMGLYTQNGIRKPSYYALQILQQLGDILVDSGKGYFISRQAGSIRIVLYNYEHFDPLFTAQGFGLSATQRDGIFPRSSNLEVSLTLSKLSSSAYRVRETILNQEHGSCFDLWSEMGGTELTQQELGWLSRNCEPLIRIHHVQAQNGSIPYSATLAPHEVRLVELTPCKAKFSSNR